MTRNALEGLKVSPKRRAKGSPRTGETSADLLRSVPTSFPSAAPVKQPGWSDSEAYDPQVLSAAAGRGITSALEGTKQFIGGAKDYLGGFMQSVRERSPEELRGTAPARSMETYETVNRGLSQAAQDPLTTARKLASAFVDVGVQATKSPTSATEFIADVLTPIPGPSVRRSPPVSQVVKPKGGDFPTRLEAVERLKYWEPDTDGPVITHAALSKEKAINNWLDTKLAKYIRSEMATPEDPIRKLAEEGILHVDPQMINYDPGMYGRTRLGEPEPTLMAESGPARVWEGATDYMMGSEKMRTSQLLSENLWFADVVKKDRERLLYLPSSELGRDLGFDHLRDELFNSIRPDSGLPRQLQLTDQQLGRMSVPDAVRHVSKINKWREKQKAEANFALANNAATVPFKDYPGQKYGWFQLTTDSPENRQVLQDALNYEADLMGHCVRGYCDDVLAGRSQIYSLRNKKTGEPHVTIEVTSNENPYGIGFVDEKTLKNYMDIFKEWKIRNNITDPFLQSVTVKNVTLALKESGVPHVREPIIKQIKGKGNLKPKDEYIPFVQDFVRSKDWDEVRDFNNTNLIDLSSASEFPNRWIQGKMADHVARQVIQDMQNEGIRFATLDELNARHSAMVKERVAARKAAEPPEAKAARQQLRELRRAERRQQRGE